MLVGQKVKKLYVKSVQFPEQLSQYSQGGQRHQSEVGGDDQEGGDEDHW